MSASSNEADTKPDPFTVHLLEALALIDDALGIPADGCNCPPRTIAAIRRMRAELNEFRRNSENHGGAME